MPLRRALRLIDSLITGAGLGVIVLAFYTYVQSGANLSADLEGRFFPVVTNYSVNDWRREDDGSISVEAFGTKVRACAYIGTSILYGGPGVKTREASFAYLDDDTPGSTRPVGTQSFGRINIRVVDFPVGGFIQGLVMHQCHGGAPTITPIGPFYSPPGF